jgi:hypothetical protein
MSDTAALPARRTRSKSTPLVVATESPHAFEEEAVFDLRQKRRVAALVRLKKLDVRATSAALGLPFENVSLSVGGEWDAMRDAEWARLSEIVGIDPETGKLHRNFPHYLHLVSAASQEDLKEVRGLLMDLLAAVAIPRPSEKEANLSWWARLFYKSQDPKVLILQNEHVRVVILQHWTALHVIDLLQDCGWARETEAASRIKTAIALERFLAGDLNASEFDDLFDLEKKMTWKRVALLARANHVSIEELIAFIKQRGDELEEERKQRLKTVEAPLRRKAQ